MDLYQYIFKRKSFHLFRDLKTKEEYSKLYKIDDNELQNIKETFYSLKPLNKAIKVKIEIVTNEYTNCNRGQEFCILFYSEKKENYLQNIGYLGEQLDLYLVSKNIGALWFGIGKTTLLENDGLAFVTMMAIGKVPEDSFRKDMFKSKRKELSEIYDGNKYSELINILRFAPSSCNTQPWFIKEENNKLIIYRYRKEGKRGIMPKDKVIYQNLIDIGIFLCFLDIIFDHNSVDYKINLYKDDEFETNEYVKEADVCF